MRLDAKLPHLPIWGDAGRIPGNTGKSKSDVMHIDKSLTMEDVFTKYPGIWDKSSDELGDLRGNDYMVWDQEMEHGYAKETYSDEPLLIPFLAPGSDRCVILCPGGAYRKVCSYIEGAPIARRLNELGISAYIVYYRVKKGDTLGKIAQKHHTTVNAICRLNGISSKKVLKIGQRLRVR